MIDGVDLIFIIPPVALIVVAVVVGLRGFSKRGMKSSLASAARVIVYGGFLLFVLFVVWVGIYYAGGGH